MNFFLTFDSDWLEESLYDLCCIFTAEIMRGIITFVFVL